VRPGGRRAAALEPDTVRDAVVFLTYAAVDSVLQGQERAGQIAQDVLAMQPAAIVLITEFSNEPGKSHGSFVGEGSVFRWVSSADAPPILYARLEELEPAGIRSWDDLARVERARVVWDADVFWPVARATWWPASQAPTRRRRRSSSARI